MVRYCYKLTNFTTGEKNRVQNYLNVSNFKLDDVFSDIFGNASSAITDKILENSAKKITDVSFFALAVDKEICFQQAEKLRIIRSHIENLNLCKANLDSSILSTAKKYLPQLNLAMPMPDIQSYSAIGIISEIRVNISVFSTSKHLCSKTSL